MKLFHICSLILILLVASLKMNAQSCDSSTANFCRSVVTDTIMNPYLTGMLGNWRNHKSYTYYGPRAFSDTVTVTNIRVNGTFQDFSGFWDFISGDLQKQEDSNRWVWNSEITKFNKKGFEIENKDPLGRYNAGLYGYNQTLPIAVIQNSKVREAGFDGFEDYTFGTQTCDTACAPGRHFGWFVYASKLDSLVKHSGKFSLKLSGNQTAGLSFDVATIALDSITPKLTINNQTDACGAGIVLKEIKANSSVLLPNFSPLQGKKMVISAWVKEAQDCKSGTYNKNRIRITFDGGGTPIDLLPSGNIIESWQRVEAVFTIPANAVSFQVLLESTDASTTVNFDDVRILPFNANMKSFVYSPVNLRLMAELDENNYATFYEYDDDGTLARVKKETERGIQTIKETRSALIKQ